MLFQLKKGQEGFTVVEGPLAGRSFAPGKLYAEIPPEATGRFQEIKDLAPAPEKPAKAESKRGSTPSEKGEVS